MKKNNFESNFCSERACEKKTTNLDVSKKMPNLDEILSQKNIPRDEKSDGSAQAGPLPVTHL